jgi:sugar transferase (PEP-CTERM/EpsH1 system associated)
MNGEILFLAHRMPFPPDRGRIASYVEHLLATRPIEAIYVFSGQMGQYVPAQFAGRVVVDLVDVDSAKFEAYAAVKSWPLGLVDAREGRLLRAEEERLAHRADRTVLVSEAEAGLLRSRLVDPVGAQVAVLRNGIDADYFDPAKVAPEPSLVDVQGPHLVFTGQMDYAPNIAAARRVIEYILPAIRQHHPYAQFHIVGRAPTREILTHDWKDGVRVWGEVVDVRPFLAGADVVTVPLEIARGVQNKVLEAMAMARPVVLTPGAATGIEAEEGRHFAVEESDSALAARILWLLTNRGAAQSMGEAARQFVVERRTWPAMLAGLPELMGGQNREGRRDAA